MSTQELSNEESLELLNETLYKLQLSPNVHCLTPGGAFFNNIRILILGRSQWGKTTLEVGLVAAIFLRHVDRIIVVSPTYDTQETYDGLRRYIKRNDVYFLAQDAIFNTIMESIQHNYAQNPELKTLLILDDLSADQQTNAGRKGSFSRLVLAAPHMGTSILAVFHQATSVTPTLRDNAEVIVSFPLQTKQDNERFKNEFLPFNTDTSGVAEHILDEVHRIWREGDYVVVIRRPRAHAIVMDKFDSVIEY